MSISCIGDEALLQVKLSLTQDEIFTTHRSPFWDTYWEWEDEEDDSETGGEDEEEEDFLGLFPFAWHQQGNEIGFKGFTPKDITDYEACVPRDECSQIVVGGLPTDGYELLFDGEAIDTGYEFYFDAVNPVTYTNVGNCPTPITPVCNDAEALFELEYWSGAPSDSESDHMNSFRVEDQDGNSVLDGLLGGTFSLDKTFACLPKDDCYTFLIGSLEQRDIGLVSSYSIFLDGELVRSRDTWLFDSIRFGSCGPSCNEDESVIEFFMHHDKYPDDEFEFKWNLDSPSVSISGVVPHGPGISFLAHETMCVPKGSCASFYIEAPDNMTRVEEQEIIPEGVDEDTLDWDSLERYEITVPIDLGPVYTLKMDDVIYRKAEFSIYFDHVNQTTNMGGCTVTGLCDVQTEDLFYYEYRVPAIVTRTFDDFPPITLPLRGYGRQEWNFGYIFKEWEMRNLLVAREYVNRAYDLSSTLKVFECVPKDGCDLSFNNTGDIAQEDYTVKKNGMQLTDGQSVGYVAYFAPYVMPFGQDCPFSSSNALTLSGGAIASVVVAVLSGLIWH